MRARYDHVIIGAGGLGAATAYWLSQLATGEVAVVEQYQLGHHYGASEDHSRIIRHGYHSPDYTALTPAMYETWRQVERHAGVPLLTLPGCVDMAVEGTLGADEVVAFAHSMAVAGLPYEELSGAEINKRWPDWRLPDGTIGLFHEEAGILDIRRATAAHVALARAHGVAFLTEMPVTALEPRRDCIAVRTAEETLMAGNVVVCAGSWAQPLVATAGVQVPLLLSQEQVAYFALTEPYRFTPDRWPVWIWHDESIFYGFPVYGEAAVKAARDMSGRLVTQETRQWEPDPEETEVVRRFLRDRLPAAAGPELYAKTCVYDMPPDREFVLDHVPGEPRLLVAIGAGHAAKFASLIGKIMAELATTGQTAHHVAPFRFDRPALTDPDFVPIFRLSGDTPRKEPS